MARGLREAATSTFSSTGEIAEEPDVLERPREPGARDAMRRQPGERAVVEIDVAGGGPNDSGDAVDERRLSGAIRPDDGEDLALLEVQAHTGERMHAGEVLADGLDLEAHRFCHFPLWPVSRYLSELTFAG